MKLLQIDSSARASSVTRQLTAMFAEEWRTNHPTGSVIHRDLSTTMLPLITNLWSTTPLDRSKLSNERRDYLSTSNSLIKELQDVDTIVVGAPMYNFSIPSLLKAWIDQVVRNGMTFGYGADGPHGLLENKQVIVITARGGAYGKGTPREKYDFQEPYLRLIFRFIGLTDVTFIHAENQLMEGAGRSVAFAMEQIGRVAAGQNQQLVSLGV